MTLLCRVIAFAADIVIDTLEGIKTCPRLSDKLVLACAALTYPVTFPLHVLSKKLLGKDLVNPHAFLLRDVLVRNPDGIFYCRRRTGDLITASVRNEEALRRFFYVEEGICVDVGANIGKWTVFLGKRLGTKGKVLAIEPEPGNFQMLLKNIDANSLKNVIPVNCACSFVNTTMQLHLHRYAPGLNTIHPSQMQDFGRCIAAPGRTLDSILGEMGITQVALIKIDVEGAEMEVLMGAVETLRRSRNLRIVIEAWNEEVLSFLTELGFRVSKIHRKDYVAEKVEEQG